MTRKSEPITGLPADPNDPDDFDISEADIQRGLVARHVRRGTQRAPKKVPVSIRLDAEVVELLRASGPGWQSRANDLLRGGLGLAATGGAMQVPAPSDVVYTFDPGSGLTLSSDGVVLPKGQLGHAVMMADGVFRICAPDAVSQASELYFASSWKMGLESGVCKTKEHCRGNPYSPWPQTEMSAVKCTPLYHKT